MLHSASSELLEFQHFLKSRPHSKRFGEKWISDPSFRSDFIKDPYQVLHEYNIKLDQQDVLDLSNGHHSSTIDYLERSKALKANWTHHFYSRICAPLNSSWIDWRKRQISRQILDLGPQHALSNLHSSLAVELNKGCSVGCWFCALSPDKNTIPLLYASGGRELFLELMNAMKRELGPAVNSGFLYWGSEPMDNPDYERYCLDFYSITGVFPPTTTAVPHKDPERTRRFLSLAEKHNAWLNRFSLASTSLMNHVHSLFTPEELSVTECLPLNADGSFSYGVGGRYREYLKNHPEILTDQQRRFKAAPFYDEIKEYLNEDTHAHGTIACVTGFLVNLVDRTISLIAPTHADDDYPLGYITFSKETFETSADIHQTIHRVVDKGRILHLEDNHICSYPDYLSTTQDNTDIVFKGRLGTEIRARDVGTCKNLDQLNNLLRRPDLTRKSITSYFPGEQAWVDSVLQRFWLMGVLKDPLSC